MVIAIGTTNLKQMCIEHAQIQNSIYLSIAILNAL